MAPARIANFNDWFDNLTVWRHCEPSEAAPGCIVVSDAARALPRWPLTDERCPVLTIVAAIKARGWAGAPRTVTHVDATTLVFDGREACHMRGYYTLVLFKLAKALPLSSGRVPSQQPGAYYRLLLKDIAVEPDQGNAFYMNLLNRNRKARGKEPLAIADEDLVPPLQDDGDGVTCAGDGVDGPPEPKAQPRSSGRGPLGPGGRHQRARPEYEPPRVEPNPDTGGGGERDPSPLRPPPLPPPPVPVVEPPVPEPEDEVVGPTPPDPPVAPRRPRPREAGDWHDGIGGARIKWKDYKLPGSEVKYPNWTIDCYHKNCEKVRGSGPEMTAMFGVIEPLAYLHAWRCKVTPSRPGIKNHRNDPPTGEEVAAYYWAHKTELEAVYARCIG